MSMTPAMESIFANAQQNAASLIETATLAINAKVNTIEEAEQMIQELSSEAVKYNELLTTIMNAMRQVESGDMQKEEAAGIIAPAVKELKDKCTALKIANAEAPGDDITEDEIAILRELIIGAKAAAEDRLVAIRLGDDDKIDPEVEAEVNTPDEAAEEGFIHNFIERRHQAKINKAKIDTLWDSMKDKKSVAILNQFAKAAAPLFTDDSANIKGMIDEMVKADQRSGKDYTGKLSAKDYIVKNFGKYTLAIMPGTPEGLGCQHILAPVANHDGDCYFFKKEICEIMMNPVKKEEVAPAQEAYEAEVATEAAFLAAKYVNTNETKTAKALYVNAKKLYSMGSKDKALQYMKQAKSLYEKALDALMKSGKFEKAERTEAFKKGGTSVSIRKNVTRTDSMSFNIARSSLESKIDRCTAHILQWTTKAGKETYQQTLDQLKADREQAKAAKKAAKATENYEMEDNNMILTDNYDQMLDAAALEAMDYEAACEGTNWDQHKMKKAYSKEVRSLAKEAKRCYRVGKYAEAKTMYMKCVDLCKQFISDVKAIPQEAKDINFGAWMYALRTMFVASDSPTETIDRNIELLNKQGKGELTPADFNKYTTSLVSEASALAKKYQKLADKAAKGELDSKATESEEFDYDEFMFACEALMDELMLDSAMESDGAEGEAAPSGIGSKLRSAMAKFKSAFKRGDKKAAEDAKKEVDAAADELAAADDGSEEKKKGLSKQAKIGITAAAVVATVATMTAVAMKLKKKAEGSEDVSGKGAAQAIKSTISKAYNDMKDNAALASLVREDRKAARDAKRDQERQTRAERAFVNQVEAQKAKKIAADNKAAAKYNKQKAKAAAKAAKEAFGISEFDAYEVILEAMNSVSEDSIIETENDLLSAIESMI